MRSGPSISSSGLVKAVGALGSDSDGVGGRHSCYTGAMTLRVLPRIEPLRLAEVTLPEGHPARRTQRCLVFGFVIDHPEGAIVVDTGVGVGNSFIDEVYNPWVDDLDAALRAVDVEPASVRAVVNSHLHFDHCGQNQRWYEARVPVYVQETEVLAARRPFYSVPEWATVPPECLRSIRGDEEIAEGVQLLATPGHTQGHQSVLVEASESRVVIAAQAVWEFHELEQEVASEANVDANELRGAAVESIRRLKRLRPDRAYFSHDPTVWVRTS